MRKEMILIVLGIFIVVIPHLGIPMAWRTTLLFLSGTFVATVGILQRNARIARGTYHTTHHPFRDNTAGHAHHVQGETIS